MARLTLARKIAAITLIVWKKGVSFDAEHLKHKQLECLWSPLHPLENFPGGGQSVPETFGFESESAL
jgi:hypothetical protein